MRTYRFDHFKAEKPEPSVTTPEGARQTHPAEETKPTVPPSEEGQLHYGRQHAQTAELYHQRRQEREEAEQLGVAGVQQEPLGGEAPPLETRKQRAAPREEPVIHGKEDVEQHAGSMPEESGRAGLRGLAQQAVTSVLQAAREASRGRPLVGAKKLAGDAVSGALKVAREVSARRASRKSSEAPKGGKGKKGRKR